MEHRKIQQFYKNLFKLASRGGGSKATENPALVFTKRAKKGEYNQISDEEYNILLKDDKGYSYIRISPPPYSRITEAKQ